jgi:5'-nucleotidase
VKILVSNDDGYLAAGITLLADALAEIAEVVVVAPDGCTTSNPRGNGRSVFRQWHTV